MHKHSVAGRKGETPFCVSAMRILFQNLFRQKKRVYLTILAVLLGIALFIPLSAPEASGITAGGVIQLVNKERVSRGLDIVAENSSLTRAAQDKLDDMIKHDYFSHTSPNGVTPWYWIEKNGYDYKYAGENLAVNFSSAEDQHESWMASSTHRKNILNPTYKEIGVAVANGEINGTYSTIAVQLFSTKAGGFVPAKKSDPLPQGSEVKSAQEEVRVGAPLPEQNIVQNEETGKSCFSAACYFQRINDALSGSRQVSEEVAWMAVVLILFFSITLNAIMLSKKEDHNPFIAANTVILLMVLTSVVFWKI